MAFYESDFDQMNVHESKFGFNHLHQTFSEQKCDNLTKLLRYRANFGWQGSGKWGLFSAADICLI